MPADHRQKIESAANDRDVWVMGGGGLAAEFAGVGMLDEVVVSIAPVTLELELKGCERNRDFIVARYDLRGSLIEG